MESNEKWEFLNDTHSYMVSTLGRVMSLTKEPRILTQTIKRNGYLSVRIHSQDRLVHRLVAETFIPNQEGFEVVNHIDENKQNNQVENLEWCTWSRNNSYGKGHESRKRTKGAQVICFDENGNLIGNFYSIAEAARQLGCACSGIAQCLHNGNSRFRGYKWVKVKEANTK